MQDYLTHMAALVRKNPNITVKQIASELKFADGKSVYYWLEKGNFRGIGHFKQTILGEDKSPPEGFSVKVDGKTLYLLKIPHLGWSAGEKDPERSFYFFHESPNPRGLFAISVESKDFFPWFDVGDIIVVNANRGIRAGDWVLLRRGKKHLIGKAVESGTIVNPITFEPLSRDQQRILGIIINQFRGY